MHRVAASALVRVVLGLRPQQLAVVPHVRGFLLLRGAGSASSSIELAREAELGASEVVAEEMALDSVSKDDALIGVGGRVEANPTKKQRLEAAPPQRPNRSAVARDLYEQLVEHDDSAGPRLKHDDVRWDVVPKMAEYAAALISAHEGSLELEAKYREQGDALSVGATSKNGAVKHLGAGVFLEQNTLPIDPDSRDDDARTITRIDLREVTREALEVLNPTREGQMKKSLVVVTGHHGTGKTRGGLTYALQELLWRGEAVLRVGYKDGEAYAFLPNKDGVYEVWSAPADFWMMSKIARRTGAYALIDPPEHGAYVRRAACNVLSYAPNDWDRHYRNIHKDGELLLTSMPTKAEMLAMMPVLWTNHAALPGQVIADDEAKRQEVLNRCDLVGCVLRHVFQCKLFEDELRRIVSEATDTASDSRVKTLTKYYCGHIDICQSKAASETSRLFDVSSSPESRGSPFVMLKPLVAHLWREELEQNVAEIDGEAAFNYEDLCTLLLRLGGSVGAVTLPQRTLLPTTSQEHTSELIRGMKKEGQTVVVASFNYPVFDYATSLYDWFKAEVGDSPTVKSGAFVSVLRNLDLADKVNGRLVMKNSHKQSKITLTMMCNGAQHACHFEDDAGNNHKDLEYNELKALFNKHVAVRFVDVTDWHPHDDDEEYMTPLLQCYRSSLAISWPRSFIARS